MYTRSYRISRQGAPALSLHERGSGEPTFLLIHGFGDGGFVWTEFMIQLASFGRVIAVDLRGHGDSDWDPNSRYDCAAHLDDVRFVVETLRPKKMILIGHSLGGEIAIRLTAQCADLVVGLVVVDFGPELNQEATVRIRQDFVADNLVYVDCGAYAAHLERKRPMISPDLRWTLARDSLRLDADGGYRLKRDPAMGANGSRNSSALPPLWPILEEIRCPVMLVRGVASSVLPLSVAKRMVEVLSNGFFASIRLAGHGVMVDNPTEFAATTLSFIKHEVDVTSDWSDRSAADI